MTDAKLEELLDALRHAIPINERCKSLDTPTPNRPRMGTLFLLDYGHGGTSRIAKEDGYYYVNGEICGSWDSFDAFTAEGSWTWRYPEPTYADGRRDAFEEAAAMVDEEGEFFGGAEGRIAKSLARYIRALKGAE